MSERIEALIRIPLYFVYSIITGVWGFIVALATIVHWFYTIIYGKRHEGIAGFANRFVTYSYKVFRYLYFVTNERPWPIGSKQGPSEMHPVDVK
jgi:hypothetical protein